jgi:hypothetical protein
MRGQFSLQHLFERVGKQAREDALLTKEVVNAFRPSQLLLNALNRRQDGCWRLLSVNHLHNLFYTLRSHA